MFHGKCRSYKYKKKKNTNLPVKRQTWISIATSPPCSVPHQSPRRFLPGQSCSSSPQSHCLNTEYFLLSSNVFFLLSDMRVTLSYFFCLLTSSNGTYKGCHVQTFAYGSDAKSPGLIEQRWFQPVHVVLLQGVLAVVEEGELVVDL